MEGKYPFWLNISLCENSLKGFLSTFSLDQFDCQFCQSAILGFRKYWNHLIYLVYFCSACIQRDVNSLKWNNFSESGLLSESGSFQNQDVCKCIPAYFTCMICCVQVSLSICLKNMGIFPFLNWLPTQKLFQSSFTLLVWMICMLGCYIHMGICGTFFSLILCKQKFTHWNGCRKCVSVGIENDWNKSVLFVM